MDERELKVGDRVRDVYETSDTFGEFGEVKGIYDSGMGLSYSVLIDGESRPDIYAKRSSLELVESEPVMKRTSKFKIGDRVKTRFGASGEIIELIESEDTLLTELVKKIKLDSGIIFIQYSDELLTLIPPENPEPFDFNKFVDETKGYNQRLIFLEGKFQAIMNGRATLVNQALDDIPKLKKEIEQLKADVFRLQKREEEKPKEEVSFFDRFKNPQEMRQFFAEEREKSKKSDILWIDNKSENEYVIRFNFTHPS